MYPNGAAAHKAACQGATCASPPPDKYLQEYNISAAGAQIIKSTVAKGVSNLELGYFLKVCQTMRLNPFNKEVWCYKDGKDNLLIFAGRDGFLARAQQHPQFSGIRSGEVCAADQISIDIPAGRIHHTINPKAPRGAVVGAYAFVFRKDGEPTVEWADFATYDKGRNTWRTHPGEMIKKVAEAHALKKAFAISGLQSEYDYQVGSNGAAAPIDTTRKEERLQEVLS